MSLMFSLNTHGLNKLLKDKKGKIVLNAFNETVNESNRKPNKF